MEWRKFTRNLASEKLNCPFFRFPFIHTLPRFFPLSNYTTSFIDEENQNLGRGGGIIHLGTVSLLLILLLETIGEKKKDGLLHPSNVADRRLISWWNWVEIDFHSNHSDYIWPMNETGGEENKRRKINDYYATFANQLEQRIYPTILINRQELEDRWSPTGIYSRPWDEDITGFTGSFHPLFDDFVAHEYIRTHARRIT